MSKGNREGKRPGRRIEGRPPRPGLAVLPDSKAKRGPYQVEPVALDAILVQGAGHAGAFAELLSRLSAARIDVVSVQGMTDERGGFSSFIYVRPADVERAIGCLSEGLGGRAG